MKYIEKYIRKFSEEVTKLEESVIKNAIPPGEDLRKYLESHSVTVQIDLSNNCRWFLIDGRIIGKLTCETISTNAGLTFLHKWTPCTTR